jgi:hypothetical protein
MHLTAYLSTPLAQVLLPNRVLEDAGAFPARGWTAREDAGLERWFRDKFQML